MLQNQYQAQQLNTLLAELNSKQVSGNLFIDAAVRSERPTRSRVLVWQSGRLVYGGQKLPSNQGFAKQLGQKVNRQEWINTAINAAIKKIATPTSIQELLEQLVGMRLFTWEQIDAVVRTEIVTCLEQVLPYAGQFRFDSSTEFDLDRGWNWSELIPDLTHRQEQWSALARLIPGFEAIPHLHTNALQMIAEPAVRQHLQEWVDGQRSLVEIATALDKDPLSVATSYFNWGQSGWVMMEGSTPSENTSLPTILAVDDSPVMQKLIKRSLATYYRVLVAGNAKDALSLIHQEQISLLLLDVSLPDIDGLELCRTVRSMSQFRTLPVIMLTGRDGLVDRLKGEVSGSTEYLTKPFEADNLRQVVGKYVNISTFAHN